MKILFLIPKLNVSGGVAKIISAKANFLSKNNENNVAILTQNKGNDPLFFDLNPNVDLFDVSLKGNFFNILTAYKKQVESVLKVFRPDVIVIADNGLKAMFFNIIIKTAIPVVLEIHCSKIVSEKENNTFFAKRSHQIVVKLRQLSIKYFSNIIMLSEESKKEWNLKSAKIIPNPVDQSSVHSDLSDKKIICVTRNNYEKGFDRIIPICKAINKKYPSWTFEVFCDEKGYFDILKLMKNNDIRNLIIHKSTKNINEYYLNSSIYISTSRFEVFPLVILEAMSFGLPVVAYNCPIGVKSILNSDFGFLIEDGNQNEFINKLEKLILDKEVRIKMGKNAQLESFKYNTEKILNDYKVYLNEIVYNELK